MIARLVTVVLPLLVTWKVKVTSSPALCAVVGVTAWTRARAGARATGTDAVDVRRDGGVVRGGGRRGRLGVDRAVVAVGPPRGVAGGSVAHRARGGRAPPGI